MQCDSRSDGARDPTLPGVSHAYKSMKNAPPTVLCLAHALKSNINKQKAALAEQILICRTKYHILQICNISIQRPSISLARDTENPFLIYVIHTDVVHPIRTPNWPVFVSLVSSIGTRGAEQRSFQSKYDQTKKLQ